MRLNPDPTLTAAELEHEANVAREPQNIIIAHEKHGDFPYASAKAVVRERLKEGYWYDEEAEAEAREALTRGEGACLEFLGTRAEHEYEGFTVNRVIS